jgi:hypothetical protein
LAWVENICSPARDEGGALLGAWEERGGAARQQALTTTRELPSRPMSPNRWAAPSFRSVGRSVTARAFPLMRENCWHRPSAGAVPHRNECEAQCAARWRWRHRRTRHNLQQQQQLLPQLGPCPPRRGPAVRRTCPPPAPPVDVKPERALSSGTPCLVSRPPTSAAASRPSKTTLRCDPAQQNSACCPTHHHAGILSHAKVRRRPAHVIPFDTSRC